MADLARSKRLLEKLNNGDAVSMRDLEGAVGKEGVAEYESQWQRELEQRSQFEDKPEAIKEYEALLHAADFDYNRAEGMKRIGKRSKKDKVGRNSRQRLRDQSETKYERAIEYLAEIIGIDASLRVWFDRDLDFDANTTTLGIDPQSVPRTVTSRSANKIGEGAAQKRSKADVKRDVLESAIAGMELQQTKGKDGGIGEKEKAILKQKLAALYKGKR